ncbi:MAG: DUF4303 domain-containing protein [Myxococcota bacterium]|nr:DUF4303 domain-containing protein [Myxococcota bacterium]
MITREQARFAEERLQTGSAARFVPVSKKKPHASWKPLASPTTDLLEAMETAIGSIDTALEVAVRLKAHPEYGAAVVWRSSYPDLLFDLGSMAFSKPAGPPPSVEELESAIYSAATGAFSQLFREHPAERFYYCALVVDGHVVAPMLSAWSEEALAAAHADAEERDMLRWSYADSPYCDFGADHFRAVHELLARRPPLHGFRTEEELEREAELRLGRLERAMARLDRDGMFGRGERRNDVVVSVEVVPPDGSNTPRLRRLNPPEALRAWLSSVEED